MGPRPKRQRKGVRGQNTVRRAEAGNGVRGLLSCWVVQCAGGGGTAAPFKATDAPVCDRWTDEVAPRYTRPALVGTRGGYRTYGGTEHLAFSACARAWEGGLRWDGARRPRKARERPGCPCLTTIFSRNLNKSAQSGQQESCRSNYPLQLL
jgi:hypothetical protein